MFERLAKRDTLHGSRPNFEHSDAKVRIVPTTSDVSGISAKKMGSTTEAKMTYVRVHMYCSPAII